MFLGFLKIEPGAATGCGGMRAVLRPEPEHTPPGIARWPSGSACLVPHGPARAHTISRPRESRTAGLGPFGAAHSRPTQGRTPVLVHGGQTRPLLPVLGAHCRSPLGTKCTAITPGTTGDRRAGGLAVRFGRGHGLHLARHLFIYLNSCYTPRIPIVYKPTDAAL